VGALTTIATSTRLTYDRRHRGTDVERDPTSAVKETLRLIDDVRRLSAFPSTSPVTVESILERGGIAISSRSTLARELAFVVQHTIHHLAIVALLLDRLGLSFDDNLSVAPSTPPRH
jgi:hypothetical protein